MYWPVSMSMKNSSAVRCDFNVQEVNVIMVYEYFVSELDLRMETIEFL